MSKDHTTVEEPVHIWFLIDRSGSMSPLQEAVVTGFNEFIDEQRANPAPTRLTLAQFDSEDPYEVLVDGVKLPAVPRLRRRQYQPRAATPLYDAMGSLIDAADARVKKRAKKGKAEEDQLVVIFTDGLENASSTWDRRAIFDRIKAKKADGWTFVFLGANQDSYAAGAGLGVSAGSISDWAPTPQGYGLAAASVSRAASAWRGRPREERRAAVDDFFGGVKEAESATR